jgi:hypothetical protein
VSIFIYESESFSTLHELDYEDDESRRLAAFHLHMKGPVLTWYNGLKTNAEPKLYRVFVWFSGQ